MLMLVSDLIKNLDSHKILSGENLCDPTFLTKLNRHVCTCILITTSSIHHFFCHTFKCESISSCCMLFNSRHDLFKYLNMAAHMNFNDAANNTQNFLLNDNHSSDEILIRHILEGHKW